MIAKHKKNWTAFRYLLMQMLMLVLLTLAVGALMISCAGAGDGARNNSYLISGTREQRAYLKLLFEEVDMSATELYREATIIELIASQLIVNNQLERLRYYIVSRVDDNPRNPNNAFFYSIIANAYVADGQYEMAKYYFEQLLHRFPDVEYNNISVHYASLQSLITLETDLRILVSYHHALIGRFGDMVNVLAHYQQLIEYYSALLDWEQVYYIYEQLVAYCNSPKGTVQCQANTDTREYIQTVLSAIRFHQSNKDWTAESLDTLLRDIKLALRNRSVPALTRLQADTNFFSRSSQQEEFDFNSQITFNIGIFLTRSQVQFEEELDANSSLQEAYLRTSGWSHRIPTWYFYFRKVDYPLDPTIDGNWEWAGILFGELL